MKNEPTWKRPPRRARAVVLLIISIIIRAWVAPLVVLGWILGAMVHAVVWGFGAAWSLKLLDAAAISWDGQRELQDPELDDEDWDE